MPEEQNNILDDSLKTSRYKEIIDIKLKDYRNKLGEISLMVSILGEGFPKGKECWESDYSACLTCTEDCVNPKKRKYLKEYIEKELNSHVLFMEQLEFIYPSLEEVLFLEENPDIDLIIIFPESPGSIDEFIKFSNNEKIAHRLRVFVEPRYHPFNIDKESFVKDSLLMFLSKYGHVYSYEDDDKYEDLIRKIHKLLGSYRVIKYKDSVRE
ncbi:MAG: hypothetical protein ACTSQP_01310 [Promethearchaeota archaeon]